MKGFSEYSLSVLSLLYSDQADAVYTHTQQVIPFENTFPIYSIAYLHIFGSWFEIIESIGGISIGSLEVIGYV